MIIPKSCSAHFFFFFFKFFRFQNVDSNSQGETFLGPLVLLMVTILAIFLLFFLSLINFRYSRLKNDRYYFLSLKLRFFISRIFSQPKLSFFRLKSTFLEIVLINISSIYIRPKNRLGFNIFYFFNQFFKAVKLAFALLYFGLDQKADVFLKVSNYCQVFKSPNQI